MSRAQKSYRIQTNRPPDCSRGVIKFSIADRKSMSSPITKNKTLILSLLLMALVIAGVLGMGQGVFFGKTKPPRIQSGFVVHKPTRQITSEHHQRAWRMGILPRRVSRLDVDSLGNKAPFSSKNPSSAPGSAVNKSLYEKHRLHTTALLDYVQEENSLLHAPYKNRPSVVSDEGRG